jgi:hypothetical protein
MRPPGDWAVRQTRPRQGFESTPLRPVSESEGVANAQIKGRKRPLEPYLYGFLFLLGYGRVEHDAAAEAHARAAVPGPLPPQQTTNSQQLGARRCATFLGPRGCVLHFRHDPEPVERSSQREPLGRPPRKPRPDRQSATIGAIELPRGWPPEDSRSRFGSMRRPLADLRTPTPRVRTHGSIGSADGAPRSPAEALLGAAWLHGGWRR